MLMLAGFAENMTSSVVQIENKPNVSDTPLLFNHHG